MTTGAQTHNTVALGILLVHGIGEQRRGDTLVNWLDAIVATINRSTLSKVSASVDSAELARLDIHEESAAHAVVRIRGEGIDERWIVVEGWWAGAFIAPSFSQLVGWSFRAIPGALAMHAAQRFHRCGDEPIAYRRQIKRTGAIAQALLLLFLAPFIVLLLGSLALVGAIPNGTLRTAIGRFQRALAATVGDSLVFLESPVRSAAMCSAVTTAFATLQRLCDAAGCHKQVILAHSQGATVALEALTRLEDGTVGETGINTITEDAANERRLVFVTFGAGINKLGALRWLSTHSGLTGDRKKDETFIDRDPVRAACVGLVAMAILGLWFWHLWGTGQLTPTELWAIPAIFFSLTLALVAAVTLMLKVNKRFGKGNPRVERATFTTLVIIFLGIVIGGVAVAEHFNAPLMPFFFTVMIGMVLFATLRLTLSKEVQEQIKETIRSPSSVTDWRDFWASADPVPNGATHSRSQDRPVGKRVWNEASLLRDHTTYWQNRDGFVLPVVHVLARTANSPWRHALPFKHAGIDERSRWRVAWLRGTRWLAPVAVLVAVVQRSAELDAIQARMGNALNGIGVGQWLSRLPRSLATLTVDGGAAILCAWIAYLTLLAFWHAWVRAEQDAVLEHKPPYGVTVGLRVFAAAAMLIVAAAFYVAKSSWPELKADWQRAELGDAAMLVFVVIIWSQILVWLTTKAYAPPGAITNRNSSVT
jgi:hypothetical protein